MAKATAPRPISISDLDIEQLSDAFVTALLARGTSKGDQCCSCHNCSNPRPIAAPTGRKSKG